MKKIGVIASELGSMPAPIAETPKASRATAAVRERRTRRGAGGRAATASVMGIRATARAGHHAARVAVATASPMPATGSQGGMFQGSMRWAAAGSRADAEASQASRPVRVPATAAVRPTAVPLATMAPRRWRGVAPAAASRPSWRMRRWARVAKLAPATRHTRTMATVATTSTATAAVVCSVAPRFDEALAGHDAGSEREACSRSASTSRVIDSGVWPAGSTRAYSSSRSAGFSTMPTTS